MVYEKIRTEYLKNKIKGGSFKDEGFRDYIGALKLLEHFIVEGPEHFAEGLHFHGLKQRFKEEYEAIKDELTPGWREREAKRLAEGKKKTDRENKKVQTVMDKEDEQFQKEWESVGGSHDNEF